MTLRETRKKCKLTQEEAAKIIGMSKRTYVAYETDETEADQLKLERMIEKLNEYAAKDTSILKIQLNVLNNDIEFEAKRKSMIDIAPPKKEKRTRNRVRQLQTQNCVCRNVIPVPAEASAFSLVSDLSS